MKRRRGHFAGVALGFTVATSSGPSAAQSRGFSVAAYEPSDPGSQWFVVDALDRRGHLRPAVGAAVDYAHKPLVIRDSAGTERARLIGHQLFAHLGASVVAFERLRFAFNQPLALYQDGESALVNGEPLRGASQPGVGDLRLSADARGLGRYGEAVSMAAGLRVWLPTGLPSQFTSDGTLRVAPGLAIAGESGRVVWAARAALVVRPRDGAYAGSPLGSQLAGDAGVAVRVGQFRVGPELFARTTLGDTFLTPRGTPADVALGVHYETPSGWRIAAAIGAGLSSGLGTAALRALGAIEWGAPIVPPDRDRDGILDGVDACPDLAGVASGDPEAHGCPAPEPIPDEDTDADGIWDRDDACPGLVGVATKDPMTHGCPKEALRKLAVATKTEIRIGEQLQFAMDSAELAPASDDVLSAVARILTEHPEIRRVRIEGHTDDTGDAAHNEDLSRRRAASVRSWLIDHGIDGERLVSEGFGSRQPLDANVTEEGRAKNRRVAFTILEREAVR